MNPASLKQLKREREATARQMRSLMDDLAAMDRLIAKYEPAASVTTAPQPLVAKTDFGFESIPGGAGSAQIGEYTSFVGMIKKAVDSLSGQFTKNQVHAKLKEMFPSVTASEQDVGSVVWRMANKSRELIVVTKGTGGSPSLYAKAA